MASVAEFLASVTPNDLIATVGKLKLYRLELVDGSALTAAVMDPEATPVERGALVAGIAHLVGLGSPEGFVTIVGADPEGRGFLAKPVPAGSGRDLPALSWSLDRRLEFFRRAATAVDRLHQANLAHGTITPEHVIFSDDLVPLLFGPQVANVRTGVYAAPETREGGPGGLRADIYSLGRLLQFVATREDPEPEDGLLLLLPSMSKEPAGLTRIVRKCTAKDPEKRYATVADLLADVARYGQYQTVGISHPDAKEENLSGLSSSLRPSRVLEEVTKRGAGGAVARPSEPGKGKDTKSKAKGKAAELGPKLSPDAQAKAKERKQKLTLAGLSALAVIIALAFAIPAIRIAMLRKQLREGTPPERREAIVALMDVDADFHGLEWKGFDFTGLRLRGANFIGCNLRGAKFDGVDLSYANFAKANLLEASFAGADLRSARIAGATAFESSVCDPSTRPPPAYRCLLRRFERRAGASKGPAVRR